MERLDQLLVRRGLVRDRSRAQRLIMAGEVRAGGQTYYKPARKVAVDIPIEIVERAPYVSRGGQKLDAALARFELDVRGWVAADVGASTGGFTDCLLQRGCACVYAIDVGYGQLDWGLRNDPRVVVMERTNARYLEELPELVDLVTVDVSFISLRLILPRAVNWLKPSGEAVALIKPQFEADRRAVEEGGVVRDPAVHRVVLRGILEVADGLNLGLGGLMPSPLRGPAGNVEFLAWWQLGVGGLDTQAAVEACMAEVKSER